MCYIYVQETEKHGQYYWNNQMNIQDRYRYNRTVTGTTGQVQVLRDKNKVETKFNVKLYDKNVHNTDLVEFLFYIYCSEISPPSG
jgi:hypothetical protein